jgi:hypothetical protein
MVSRHIWIWGVPASNSSFKPTTAHSAGSVCVLQTASGSWLAAAFGEGSAVGAVPWVGGEPDPGAAPSLAAWGGSGRADRRAGRGGVPERLAQLAAI